MKIGRVKWTKRAFDHIEEENGDRRISRADIEEVLLSPRRSTRASPVGFVADGREKWMVEGTVRERALAIILLRDSAFNASPLTAWPLSGAPLRRYNAWRRSIRA